MKYFFFATALLGVFPAVILLLASRRFVRWGTLGLLLPLLLFNETAINFLSHETYRGTSRGMEISIIYLVALVLLLTFFLGRKPMKFFPDTGSLFYLAYFLCSIPSVFNAANGLFSFFELWKMFMIYLVFLAVYNYLEYSDGDFDIFLYGIAAVVAINFFVIVKQHFHG